MIEDRLFRYLIPGSIFMLLVTLLLLVYPGPELRILGWFFSGETGIGVLGLAGGVLFIVVGFVCNEVSMALRRIEEAEILAEHLENHGDDIGKLWGKINRTKWPRQMAKKIVESVKKSDANLSDPKDIKEKVLELCDNAGVKSHSVVSLKNTYSHESYRAKVVHTYRGSDTSTKRKLEDATTEFIQKYYAQRAMEVWVHICMARGNGYGELKPFLQRNWSRILIANNSVVAMIFAALVWFTASASWVITSSPYVMRLWNWLWNCLGGLLIIAALEVLGGLVALLVLCVGFCLWRIVDNEEAERKWLFNILLDGEVGEQRSRSLGRGRK